ncbi:MAG: sugar nucleotide-binding protein [Pseudomonadota bacterium]
MKENKFNGQPTVIIIGSDGLIGSSLVRSFLTQGIRVIGTTRRPYSEKRFQISLDLSNSEQIESWIPPSDVNLAIHCAGITKIVQCDSDPLGSFTVNVKNTTKVARKLFESGVFQVFLSTNHVFDGSKPFRSHAEPTCPVNEYGKQKAKTELHFLNLGKSAIIRFTKIIGSSDNLLGSWVTSLKRGQQIQPFINMFMSPVPLSTALNVLKMISFSGLTGIFQVSGERDISYAEVARMGARAIKVSEDLVTPILSTDAGFNMVPPENTTLNTDRLLEDFGISVPSVQWTLSKAFLSPQTLAGQS